jgi:hypothetical protein
MAGDVRAIFVTTHLEETLKAYVRRVDGVPMEVLADGLITAIDDEFQSEGKGEWPDFAESTLKRHPERKGGQLLHADSGELSNIQQMPGSPGPNFVEVGSPAKYSIYHTSPKPRKQIPLRDFLDIDMPAVLDGIADDILREIA